MDNKNVRYLEPEIKYYRTFEWKNLVAAVLIGALLVGAFVITSFLLVLELLPMILVALITLVVYSIFLFFLLEPRAVREINQRIIETIEKPVYREVYFDRPVTKEVIVEKPVIKEVVRNVMVPEYREVIVEKPVYIERPRKKLNIPKYKFLGSTQAKTYHLRACRLSKLIKKKYKVSNNSKNYFKNKKFKACKICIVKLHKSRR